MGRAKGTKSRVAALEEPPGHPMKRGPHALWVEVM
jgi:hypothetical protein